MFPQQCPSIPAKTQLVVVSRLSDHKGLHDQADIYRELPSNARTRSQFKPRNANKGTSSYQLRQFAEATLGSGSLRKAVKLPEGEDVNEWLAVNGKRISSLISPKDKHH